MRAAVVLAILSLLALWAVRPTKLQSTDDGPAAELQPIPAEVRRTLAFGYRTCASDVAWLDAIQYFGDAANAQERFRRLASILDLVTDLDPHFEYAYEFAGETVPYHEPNGEKLWYNTKKTITLLRKGVQSSPQRWEVPWLLAYTLYSYWGQYQEAGLMMLQAADLAERGQRADERYAPPTYLRELALRLLAQGGSIETAIDTTRLALANAGDDQQRAELEGRLAALTLDQELQLLNSLAEKKAAAGDRPKSVPSLTSGSDLAGLSQDPYGDDFFLDATGRVKSHNEDKLLRLKIHPGEPAIERAFD